MDWGNKEAVAFLNLLPLELVAIEIIILIIIITIKDIVSAIYSLYCSSTVSVNKICISNFFPGCHAVYLCESVLKRLTFHKAIAIVPMSTVSHTLLPTLNPNGKLW